MSDLVIPSAHQIRVATSEDIDQIRAIAEAAWFPTYAPILSEAQSRFMFDAMYSSDALRAQMTTDGHHFLLLSRDQHPEGFLSYSPASAAASAWKIHKLYICPAQQNSGGGRALLIHVTQLARRAGVSRLVLNVNRHNPARFFYERCGFRIVATEDLPFGPYWMNDYRMERNVVAE